MNVAFVRQVRQDHQAPKASEEEKVNEAVRVQSVWMDSRVRKETKGLHSIRTTRQFWTEYLKIQGR